MWTAETIELSIEDRVELERRVNSPTTPQRDVKRALIVLRAADAVPSRQIAVEVRMHESYVAVWRRRFRSEGLAGLTERRHTGRPRRLGHDERLMMIAAATSEKDPDDPIAMWTLDELVEVLATDHAIVVSRSQLGKILASMDIDLRRVRGWLNRRDDPEFWGRVRDVCGLYLNPPDRAIVLSVDEKTGIQAKQRLRRDRPPVPGRPTRREFEYRRHGVASLVAALNVTTGEVLADSITRNDSTTFISFLETIDASTDPGVAIHIVLDNGSSHTSKATRAWFDAHSRWTVHYTPKHASWVNQVELFFSILQRKVIRNGNFDSRDDLINKMLSFITDYDQHARPFKWTYAADPLVA